MLNILLEVSTFCSNLSRDQTMYYAFILYVFCYATVLVLLKFTYHAHQEQEFWSDYFVLCTSLQKQLITCSRQFFKDCFIRVYFQTIIK